MTNQKLQIQAKFYLPKQEGEWEVENRDGRDPVTPVQKNVYKAKINEDESVYVTIQLTATTLESLEKQMDGKEKSRSGIIREHLKQELHPGII